ncbi:MAG: GGDEF domain-containing protein [Spirochaetaceae bacterium]|nr:GGDEF domain-containing protein [Spirochaetaceae bacterium]
MNIYDNDVLDIAIKEFNYILDINLDKRIIERLFSNIPQIMENLTFETFILTFGSNVPLVDKAKAHTFINHITSALTTKDLRPFVVEIRFINFLSINKFQWTSIKVNFIEKNGDIHAIIVSRDITDEKENEIQVVKASQRDALTDLYNRKAFNTLASNLLSHSDNTISKLAFFFVDIDNFKNVNDIFGHQVGDRVLIEVANILTKTLNSESIVCRYGGDEFIALVPNLVNEESINELGTSICSSIQTINIPISDQPYFEISCSIGISIAPDHSNNLEELTSYSDLALYKAKAQGKNQFNIYDKNYISNRTYSKIKEEDKIVNHYDLLDKVLLNSDSGILVTDSLDYKVLFVNKSFCHIFKIPEKDIYCEKKPCYSLIYGLSEPCIKCNLLEPEVNDIYYSFTRNGRKYTRQTKKVEWMGHFIFISYYNLVISDNELAHIANDSYISGK